MRLEVDVMAAGGGEATGLAAAEVTRELTLGGPAAWSARLDLRALGPRAGELAGLAERGGLTASFVWRGGRGDEALGRAWGVRVARDPENPGSLRVTGVATGYAPGSSDAGPARRRVVRGATPLAQARALGVGPAVPPDLAHHLGAVRLPQGERAASIQDGVDDPAHLGALLAQYAALQPAGALRSVVVTAGGPGAGRWHLGWAGEPAFRALGRGGERALRFAEGDGADGPEFAGGPVPVGPAPTAARRRSRRPFTRAAWGAWSALDLPRTVPAPGGRGRVRAVVRLVDRFYPTHDDAPGWDTTYESTDPGASPAPAGPAARPWLGWGVAGACRDGWLGVRLARFEPGADLIDARLLAATSGPNGRRGLHLEPADGEPVLVAWSGWLDEPPVALGNVREAQPELPAPSAWFGRRASVRLDDDFEARVAGLVRYALDGRLDVEAGGPIHLRADGGTAALDSEGWATGRVG